MRYVIIETTVKYNSTNIVLANDVSEYIENPDNYKYGDFHIIDTQEKKIFDSQYRSWDSAEYIEKAE